MHDIGRVQAATSPAEIGQSGVPLAWIGLDDVDVLPVRRGRSQDLTVAPDPAP
jgi:hypothetical protein